MPSRKNIKAKTNKKTLYYCKTSKLRRRKDRGLQSNFSNRRLKYLDDILYYNKCMMMKGKESWKVVPKDSCEVYKARRKRQLEEQRKTEEEKDYESDEKSFLKRGEDNKNEKTSRTSRRSRVNRKRNRRRYSSSSYSTRSRCSCSSCMDYQ